MNNKTRPLTMIEYKRLIANSPEPWSHIFQIGFMTALRVGDLIALTWAEVGSSISVVEQKTGKLKTVPVGPAMKLSLDYFRHKATRSTFAKYYDLGRQNHVFPFADASAYRKALVRCCSYASITLERIAFHSLRKTAATMICENLGVVAASNFLNHSKLSTTMMYIEQDSILVNNLLEAEAMMSNEVKKWTI